MRPHYPPGNRQWYKLNTRLCEPQRPSICGGVNRILITVGNQTPVVQSVETRFLGCSTGAVTCKYIDVSVVFTASVIRATYRPDDGDYKVLQPRKLSS
jgi:hypothetical protein